jgi:hypothetical protein
MDGDGSPTTLNAPRVESIGDSKQELARQLAQGTGNENGGLFAQLSSNPFFTAVSLNHFNEQSSRSDYCHVGIRASWAWSSSCSRAERRQAGRKPPPQTDAGRRRDQYQRRLLPLVPLLDDPISEITATKYSERTTERDKRYYREGFYGLVPSKDYAWHATLVHSDGEGGASQWCHSYTFRSDSWSWEAHPSIQECLYHGQSS